MFMVSSRRLFQLKKRSTRPLQSSCVLFWSWNKDFSEEKIVNVAEVNQQRCLESEPWLENVEQTHLVLASRKLVLQKNCKMGKMQSSTLEEMKKNLNGVNMSSAMDHVPSLSSC